MSSPLTKAQQAASLKYIAEYEIIAQDTTPIDKEKAEEVVRKTYSYPGLKADPSILTFLWVDSPRQGLLWCAELTQEKYANVAPKDVPALLERLKASGEVAKGLSQETIRSQVSRCNYGSFEAYWVSYYDFVAKEVVKKQEDLIDISIDLVKHTGIHWPLDRVCIMVPKPRAIRLDENKKLHCTTGPSVEYVENVDGQEIATGFYHIHGKPYPSLMEAALAAKYGE